MKIIDNAVPPEEIQALHDLFHSPVFPWYLKNGVSRNDELDKEVPYNYFFYHVFYSEEIVWSEYFEPILNLFVPHIGEGRQIIRLKANLYPRTPTVVHHAPHNDHHSPVNGAILYVNTNDGLTVVEDGKKIESVSNRMVLFDAYADHNSTTCSDRNYRINVALNYT